VSVHDRADSFIRSCVFLLDAPPFRLPSLRSPLLSPLPSSSAAIVPSRRRPRSRSFPAGVPPRRHPPPPPSTTAVNCRRHRSWPQRAAATGNPRLCRWLLQAPPPTLVGAPVGGRRQGPVLARRSEADRCSSSPSPRPPPVFPPLTTGMRDCPHVLTRSCVPMMLPLRPPWRREWARRWSDGAARSARLLRLGLAGPFGRSTGRGVEGKGGCSAWGDARDRGMRCMGGCEGPGDTGEDGDTEMDRSGRGRAKGGI